MTRNGGTHIFDANVALDNADRQISGLPTEPYNHTHQETVAGLEVGECEVEHPRQDQRDTHGTQCAFPGLIRANIATEWMPAKQFTTGIRRYVVDLHSKQDVEQVTIGISCIGQKGKVPKHPPEIDKADNGERERL